MDKQEFLNKITEIGSCEDEVSRRELLTELSDEGTKLFDRNAELDSSNRQLSDDNEKLRSANMKLFLKVGESRQPEADPDTQPTEKRKFSDLFNEKGGLK